MAKDRILKFAKSFATFEEKYGGKVFIIFSARVGDKKVIQNKEVIAAIKAEIERLQNA